MRGRTSNPPQTAQAANPPPPEGKPSRLVGLVGGPFRKIQTWAALHRPAAVGLAAISFLLISGVVLWWLLARPADPVQASLDTLAALDQQDDDLAATRAEQLAKVHRRDVKCRGTAAYVLGVVALHRAQAADGPMIRRNALAAAAFLEQARRLGFPQGRQADGLAFLGRSQLLAGNQAAALSAFEAALLAGGEPKMELHGLAVEAALQLASPLPRVALDHLAAILATPDLSERDRVSVALQQAQVQLSLEEWESCRKTLETLAVKDRGSGAYCNLAGQLLMRDAELKLQATVDNANAAADAQELYLQAANVYRQGLKDRNGDIRVTASMTQGLAQAYRALGKPEEALRQLRRIQTAYSDGHFAMQAALAEADVLLQRLEYAAVVEVYRQQLNRGPSPAQPWPKADELQVRERCLVHWEQLKQAGAYSEAASLLQICTPVLPTTERTRLLAQTLFAWGERLLEQAKMEAGPEGLLDRQEMAAGTLGPRGTGNSPTPWEGPSGSALSATTLVNNPTEASLSKVSSTSRRGKLLADARLRFRQAGRVYSQLAKERRTTKEYPDDLWAAAEAFRAARDYPAAIAMLRGYLEHARPGERQAEALNLLGEVWLAEGNAEEAVLALQQVLELYPRHPAKYTSRLLLSQAWLEQGDAEQAAQALEDNLQGNDLAPASPEWKASLFGLARLRYGQQQWQVAAPLFEQAVARYPEDRETPLAWYLLGECCIQRARERTAEFAAPLAVAERERLNAVRQLHAQALAAFDACLQTFESDVNDIDRPTEAAAVLRNASFARAAVLLQLGKHQQALESYAELINQYQQLPAVLNAYVQMAAIYRDRKQPDEAKNAVAAARSALQRLPADGALKKQTGMIKEEWERYLQWLGKL